MKFRESAMSRRFVVTLTVIFLLLLLAVGTYLFQQSPKGRAFALTITGPPGCEVVGYVIVDGVKQRVEGKLPLNLPYIGHKLEYAIVAAEGDMTKSISLVVTREGKVWGSATGNGVKGGIEEHRGLLPIFGGGSSYIGGMSTAEIEELTKK